jgi:hypothetical protein
MVSVKDSVPQFVLDGDVETFERLHDPSPRAKQKLREATGDDRVRLLARAWFANFHGSRFESKRLFVLLMKEEDIPFDGEDIQAITNRPPVDTQT